MPIKILETIRQGKIGGGETHVLDLVERLDRSQFEPVVLSFTPGPMVERLNAMGVKTHVIPTTVPFDPRVIRKVAALIEAEGIELVHAHGTRAASNSYRAARRRGVPMIYTVHGWSIHPSLHPLMFKARAWSEGLLTEAADLVINVSQANQAEGRKYFPLRKSEIVYYGIDTERFDPGREELADLRGELRLPQDQTLVGFVARMTTQKDPLTMVEAIERVAAQADDIHFLLVGDGELRGEAAARVKAYGLQERVTFTGFRQDVPNVLHSLDVYVLPSLWEGLSIAMLEALAMGKTALASAVDGNVEAITHEDNGLLIQPQDPEGLAQAILRVHQDRELAQRLGQQARQTVLQRFSLPVMVANTESQYRQVLGLQPATQKSTPHAFPIPNSPQES